MGEPATTLRFPKQLYLRRNRQLHLNALTKLEKLVKLNVNVNFNKLCKSIYVDCS